MTSTQNDEIVKEEPQQEQLEEKKPKKKRSQPRDSKAVAKVAKRFSSCGRCSFFLAAYRVADKNASFATAVASMRDKHLTLHSDYQIRKLIMKSYGVRIFSDTVHVTSCCPECKRPITYSEKEQAHIFQIQL